MAASALLNHHPSPSDEELKEAMLGNLCRCTGYYKIMDAIRTAAAEMAAPGAPR
jgi:carbon-monoxide dehydrogenase small subunit